MRNVRFISSSSLAVLVALGMWAAASDRAAAEGIDGTWKPVAIEKAGRRLPDDLVKQIPGVIVFEGGKMRALVGDKVAAEGDYKIDASKTPKTYEMRAGKDRKGRAIVNIGIYEIDDKGQLRICFDDGEDAVAPKSFDTKANPSAQLMIYERVK